eukprot:scaffold3750_cov111-Skeletonema_dohrnii-CCMP3373.AAC.8
MDDSSRQIDMTEHASTIAFNMQQLNSFTSSDPRSERHGDPAASTREYLQQRIHTPRSTRTLHLHAASVQYSA